jgi:putative membrane protein
MIKCPAYLALSASIVISLAGCSGQSEDNSAESASTNFADNGTVIVEAPPPVLQSSQDVTRFLSQAAIANRFVVESSELALRKARNGEIRRFARRAIATHGPIAARLNAAAPDIALPTALDAGHREMLASLRRSADGPEFATSYLDQQTEAQQTLLKSVTDLSENTTAPVQQLARSLAPAVAQQIATLKKLDKAGADAR